MTTQTRDQARVSTMSDIPIEQTVAAARDPASPAIEAGDPAPDPGAGKTRPLRPLRSPGLVPIAASLAAVVFSGVSLYETVLKPARPKPYIAEAMLLGHRGGPDYAEAVVVPVTIANYGSRSAVVTRIRLAVTRHGVPGTRIMGSAYSGDTPRADRLFTAVPVAGHQSAAGGVVFTPADDGGTIFAPGAYEVCLTIQGEADDNSGIFALLPALPAASFQFAATVPDFDGGQLDAGTVVAMKTVGHPAPSCDPPG